MYKLYFGFWPTVTVLYHEQEAPYLNILLDEARQTLKEVGTGYNQCTLANSEAHENTNDMQVVTDRMSSSQKVKQLIDWSMSENGNTIDFPFARSVDHPYIANETKAFFIPPATPSPCTTT